jgi:hypothetical protein
MGFLAMLSEEYTFNSSFLIACCSAKESKNISTAESAGR